MKGWKVCGRCLVPVASHLGRCPGCGARTSVWGIHALVSAAVLLWMLAWSGVF